MNELISNGGVCRTAPAKPGLLKIQILTIYFGYSIPLTYGKFHEAQPVNYYIYSLNMTSSHIGLKWIYLQISLVSSVFSIFI